MHACKQDRTRGGINKHKNLPLCQSNQQIEHENQTLPTPSLPLSILPIPPPLSQPHIMTGEKLKEKV